MRRRVMRTATRRRLLIAAAILTLALVPGVRAEDGAGEDGGRAPAEAARVPADAGASPSSSDAERDPLATIVVTATRTATRLDQVTTSTSVIDERDIRQQQAEGVLELLRNVPGIDIVQQGSRGANSEIFIRGAEADQTLVLIDGVEVNSVTLGAFDFANLTTDNIERIEVVRGSGGTLYGSRAIGGVVNIITRRGRGAPRVSASGAGGSGDTARGTVGSSGQIGRLGYSVAGAYLDSQGFRPQNDDYRNGTASLRLDYDVAANAAARVFVRYTDADFGLVNSNNFLSAPDPNARMADQFLLVKGEWEQEVIPNLELRASLAYTRDDQQFRDPPDAAETTSTRSNILGEILTGEIQVDHYWRDLLISTIGVDVDLRMADVRTLSSDPVFGDFPSTFDESQRNVAGFLQEQISLLDGGLIGVGGVRVDGNDDFGNEVSPAGSLSYALGATGLRLKAGYAEAFKAPSFNELFFPDFGNPDLAAETSREVDVGVLGRWLDGRATVEVTLFDRRTENLIEGEPQPDGSFRAENRGTVRVEGVEVAPSLIVWRDPAVTFQASYTRLDTVKGPRPLRRPKDRGAMTVNVAGRDLLHAPTLYDLNVNLHVVGDRPDVDPAAGFTRAANAAYTKVDVAGSYTFVRALLGHGDLTLFAKVENLFDADYEETLGFPSPRLNFLAGVRAAF
jgi:vitamin B12 transporter